MKGIQGTSNETYRKIMGNGLQYEVPKFQRDYSWEAAQWDDLWQDVLLILSKEEQEHYMGYLVLQTTDNKKYTIIDGQQRLTTLTILVLSIIKNLEDITAPEEEKKGNKLRAETYRKNYIGLLDTVTLISNNKLKLNRNSDAYFKNYIVLLKELPLRNTNRSEKNMRECFLWFDKKIAEKYKTGKDIATFMETVADKLFFTIITVTDQVNAFKVFETLNARGVQLSSADLLKNYLFSIVDASGTHETEIETLESLWSSVVGKLGNKKIEDFVWYFWNSSHKTVRKNQLFKTLKNSIRTKEEVFSLIRDLDEMVAIYLAIQDPENEIWSESPEVKKSLKELKLFQIKQTYSLLMAGYKNLEPKAFIKLVKSCVIISFRYNVIGGLNPNDQESVYNNMANDISKNKAFNIVDFKIIYVSDEKFKNDFINKQFKKSESARNHKIVKYIYSEIERVLNNGMGVDAESDTYTVEHILPQSADENWGDFTDEQINRSIYRLGNLALLEKSLNKDAGVLNYTSKKEIFLKSNIITTNTIPEKYENWNENKISERQKELSKNIKGVWKIQELHN